jgi:hypothetical protein
MCRINEVGLNPELPATHRDSITRRHSRHLQSLFTPLTHTNCFGGDTMSLTAVMEPWMFGVMEPQTGR